MVITKQRLNDIAQRKLASLGIETRLADDGQTLIGTLCSSKGALRHPRTGEAIPQADFSVEGHDYLVPMHPPLLRALPPVQFYEFDRIDLILARVGEQLSRRFAAAQRFCDRLAGYELASAIDDLRGVAVAQLPLTGGGTVILEGNPQGLVARTFVDVGGASIPMGDIPVSLEEFPSKIDLELSLSQYAEHAKQTAAAAPATTGAANQQSFAVCAPNAGQTSTGMLVGQLGEKFVVGSGTLLRQEMRLGDEMLRLDLRCEQGTLFSGRLWTDARVLWEGQFDLTGFSGVETLLETALGYSPKATSWRPDFAGPADPAEPVSTHAMPYPGEVWLMNLEVTQEDPQEVRYVTYNPEGERFGAPRVLSRTDFHTLFIQTQGNLYRLIVTVLSANERATEYQHLNAQRQPYGERRNIATSLFVSTFSPEAAAY